MYERFAEWYDAIYAARGKDHAAEAAWIAERVRERAPGAGSLLDVGCGTGLHLRAFARRFPDVAGLDAAPAMLGVARPALPGIPLHLGEMTRFDLGRRFDVVTSLFAAIGYLAGRAELDAALRCMAQHLAPGGVLALEPALTPERVRPARSVEDRAERDGTTVRRLAEAEHGDAVLRIRFTFTVDAAGGEREQFVEEHPIRLFAESEYRSAIEAAGLVDAELVPAPFTAGGVWFARAAV